MCAFLSCCGTIIPQNRRKKRESCYKSGISGTKFEGRFQNVKLVYKTGRSCYIRASGESWEGTGPQSQKKSGIIPWNRIPDTAYSPTTPVSTGKGAGGKKYAEQRTVNIRSYPFANSVNPSVTVTVNSMKKRYACTVLNRLMPVTDAVR